MQLKSSSSIPNLRTNFHLICFVYLMSFLMSFLLKNFTKAQNQNPVFSKTNDAFHEPFQHTSTGQNIFSTVATYQYDLKSLKYVKTGHRNRI